MTTMPPASPPRCMTCRHWLARDARSGRSIGECRRYPPAPSFWPGLLDRLRGRMPPNGRHPRTQAADWCGEHRSRASAAVAPLMTMIHRQP